MPFFSLSVLLLVAAALGMALVRQKRPNVRIRDGDGRLVSLTALERLVAQEAPSHPH